jgi:CubicO group peptidase (beta-lactamase class C family)
MNRRTFRAGAGISLVFALLLAACGDPVVADPHNPGGFITPSPVPQSPSGPSSPAPTSDLRGVAPDRLDGPALAELDRYIEDAMLRFGVPGAAVAVVQDGDVSHVNTFGVRDVATQAPVTPETLMKIGSVTKSMTTLMIADLDEEGVLSWDTRAVDILPWFKTTDDARTSEITVRDLVSNSTGLMRRDTEVIFTASDLDAEGVVRSIASFGFDPAAEFRKTFGYSNQMVAAGGYIAAHAAGGTGDLYRDFVDQIRLRVFDPIGMRDTTFSLDEVTAGGDYASPHAFNLDYSHAVLPVEQEEFLSPFAPAGAAWSNVSDMARYLATQIGRGVTPDGNRLVASASLQKTWAPQVEVAPGAGYGLGWFAMDYKGQPRVGHGGDTLGFSSNIDFLPEAGIGVVVLTNVGGMSSFGAGVASRAYELAFDQPMETDARLVERFDAQKAAYLDAAKLIAPRLDPDELEGYPGDYVNRELGEVRLNLEGETLTLDAGDFVAELGSVGNGTFIFVGPPMPTATLTLDRDPNGAPRLSFVTNNPDAPGTWEFVRQ